MQRNYVRSVHWIPIHRTLKRVGCLGPCPVSIGRSMRRLFSACMAGPTKEMFFGNPTDFSPGFDLRVTGESRHSIAKTEERL